ncbi:GntR family transcriptional regulator [Massilia sp.]|uniref:GntR family transcriptional regulator n=1 Tax=Massilia sp. TaxID=1882437 RepID=UPI0028A10E2C|nr:GntR family transcriptional regulator [Massilia sp.]
MQDSAIEMEAIPGTAMPSVPKLARQHLHDTVVGHLRKLIVESVFPPGAKLNERELCETMGISRTPLREALKALAAEGLVDIAPNRGASVYKMSREEVWEAFEFVSGLEAMAGELACQRITPAEVDGIKTLHAAMLACKAQGDLPGYYSNNQAIHNQITMAARNTVLLQTYMSMNRRLQALRQRTNVVPTKWDQAVDEHSQMIEALDARDGKRLGKLLADHLLDKRDSAMQLLSAPTAK